MRVLSGPGASNLAISGNNLVLVFFVSPGVTVTISDLTIENGNHSFGGGISNQGTLSLSNSVVSGNLGGQDGGGIYNLGTLTVTNSTFSGNSAIGFGGGINNNVTTTLTVTNSTFSGNSATGGSGGGISNFGTLTVTNSTFAGNSAGSTGGGIRNTGTLTVTNSTFAGNSAGSTGGGIRNTGTLTVKSTLLANNPSGGNCFNSGTFTSLGYNLSDDTSFSSFFTGTGDVDYTPAGLDPSGLQDNGGPTFTHALLAGSPAIDAGNPASPGSGGIVCEATDQRGAARGVPIEVDRDAATLEGERGDAHRAVGHDLPGAIGAGRGPAAADAHLHRAVA